MPNDSSAIVSKVWNYAHVLKNAGVGYGDYVEQITYLLLAPTFGLRAKAQPSGLPVSPTARLLKLAPPSLKLRRAGCEMTELGFDPPAPPVFAKATTGKRLRRAGNPIPAEFQWSELSSKSGDELEVHYRHTLENLGKQPGLVGIIFRKARNDGDEFVRGSQDKREYRSLIGPETRFRESHYLDQLGLGKAIDRDKTHRPDLDFFENPLNPAPLKDLLHEFQFADQSSFREMASHCFRKQSLKMCWDDKTEHAHMSFILATGLIEAKQAMALALEEEEWVHDADAFNQKAPGFQTIELMNGNAVNIRHDVHHQLRIIGDVKDADLSVSGRSAGDQPPSVSILPQILERRVARPDIAILGSERSERSENFISPLAAVVFRPEVDRLSAFEKLVGSADSKFPEEHEEVGKPGFCHDQRPIAALRFSMRAFLKKSSGKIEFSRCRTMGSSPISRRAASARRDAAFSASRAFRSNCFSLSIEGKNNCRRHRSQIATVN